MLQMDHKSIKLSVIIPVLNIGKDRLERAILSVLTQDYPNKELIVMDGGSTDDTVEAITKNADGIAYWSSAKDKNAHEAIEKGLKHVTGDFVGIIGGTDNYEEGAFSAIAESYATSGGDVLYGDIIYLSNNDKIRRYETFRETDFSDIYWRSVIGTIGTFTRTELVKNVWSGVDLPIVDDLYLFIKLYREKRKFVYVDSHSALASWRLDGVTFSDSYRQAYYHRMASYMAFSDSEELMNRYKAMADKKYSSMVQHFYKQILSPDMYKSAVIKCLNTEKNYIVWGAGRMGKKCLELLDVADIRVKYCIDSKPELQGNDWNGYSVKSPESLKEEKESILIISSQKYEKQIMKQINEMSLSIEKCSFADITYRIYKLLGDDILNAAYQTGIIS